MAVSSSTVQSNLLCYTINKFKKISSSTLKALLVDFYSSNVIAESKNILIGEIDKLCIENVPRVARRHRETILKPAADVDDILLLITFLDEGQKISSLPAFVSSSPDEMPSLRITDRD